MTLRTVFGAEPRASIALASRSTSSALDRLDPPLADRRRDVDALHRLAVLPVREPRALDRKPLRGTLGGLVDGARRSRPASTAARRLLGLHQRRERLLRLGAREPVGSPALRTLARAGGSGGARPACASARSRRPTSRRSGPSRMDASWPPIGGARRNWTPIGPQWPVFAARQKREKPRISRAFVEVGETGFEPATARPPAGCATRLRHSPWCFVVRRAGDGNRTRPKSLEGSCATTTLRPRDGFSGMITAARVSTKGVSGKYSCMQIPGVHIETLHNPVRYTYCADREGLRDCADAEPGEARPRRAAAALRSGRHRRPSREEGATRKSSDRVAGGLSQHSGRVT